MMKHKETEKTTGEGSRLKICGYTALAREGRSRRDAEDCSHKKEIYTFVTVRINFRQASKKRKIKMKIQETSGLCLNASQKKYPIYFPLGPLLSLCCDAVPCSGLKVIACWRDCFHLTLLHFLSPLSLSLSLVEGWKLAQSRPFRRPNVQFHSQMESSRSPFSPSSQTHTHNVPPVEIQVTAKKMLMFSCLLLCLSVLNSQKHELLLSSLFARRWESEEKLLPSSARVRVSLIVCLPSSYFTFKLSLSLLYGVCTHTEHPLNCTKIACHAIKKICVRHGAADRVALTAIFHLWICLNFLSLFFSLFYVSHTKERKERCRQWKWVNKWERAAAKRQRKGSFGRGFKDME